MASRQNHRVLADAIGVDAVLLHEFRCGEATLSSDVIDRLIAALDLRLMKEIASANRGSTKQ